MRTLLALAIATAMFVTTIATILPHSHNPGQLVCVSGEPVSQLCHHLVRLN